MDPKTSIILGLAFCVVAATAVYAVHIVPANKVEWVSETYYAPWNVSASESDVTEGGNITVLDISVGNQSTERWAGYLGELKNNESAQILLANANAANVFYSWDLNLSNGGEVCAGRGNTYTWTNLSDATNAEIDTTWNFTSVSDDADATFDDTAVNLTIADTLIAPDYSADTGTTGNFSTTAAKDGTAGETDFLFCSAIDMDGIGYDGSAADYEIIVPTTPTSTETYYFYVELN